MTNHCSNEMAETVRLARQSALMLVPSPDWNKEAVSRFGTGDTVALAFQYIAQQDATGLAVNCTSFQTYFR
jgi:dTDP-glucose pyrophosphorylase